MDIIKCIYAFEKLDNQLSKIICAVEVENV